jgi:hypothetical protein
VEGEVTLSPSPIESCTQKHVELQVKKVTSFVLWGIVYIIFFDKVFVVSSADSRLPLLVEDAMRPDVSNTEGIPVRHVGQEIRLENRVIDLWDYLFTLKIIN